MIANGSFFYQAWLTLAVGGGFIGGLGLIVAGVASAFEPTYRTSWLHDALCLLAVLVGAVLLCVALGLADSWTVA